MMGNLFKNALQALELNLDLNQGPQIEWTLTESEKGELVLFIEDNGAGIAPSAEAKVFTPFFTTKALGTGLGLSFAKKVIEDHGGVLSYWGPGHPSNRLGGACFELRLPIWEESESTHITEVPLG